MYAPPPFRCTDAAIAARLMREHPLASLISNGPDGLPLQVQADEAGSGFVLHGHINQHRPEAHAAMHAAYADGAPEARALAAWRRALRMAPGRPQGDIEP